MKHNVAKQHNLETAFKSVLCFNTTGAVDKIKIYLKQTNNITTMHGLINNKQVHTENTNTSNYCLTYSDVLGLGIRQESMFVY